MKTKTFILTFTVFLGFTLYCKAQTQIPNGGFENWQDSITLQSWHSLFEYEIGEHPYKTTDSHSGNYAAEIVTIGDSTFSMTSAIFLFSFDIITEWFNAGVPINSKPSKLKGFYKHLNGTGNPIKISLSLTKWNNTTSKRDTLFFGEFLDNQNKNVYTAFEIPISYNPSNLTPDSFNIKAMSSLTAGSSLLVDDFSFEYENGINDAEAENTITIFPNPSTGLINLSLKEKNNTVKIFDLQGREIYSQKFLSNKFEINLTEYRKGIYFLKVNNEIGTIIKKIEII